jgi:hypothetical protein
MRIYVLLVRNIPNTVDKLGKVWDNSDINLKSELLYCLFQNHPDSAESPLQGGERVCVHQSKIPSLEGWTQSGRGGFGKNNDLHTFFKKVKQFRLFNRVIYNQLS